MACSGSRRRLTRRDQTARQMRVCFFDFTPATQPHACPKTGKVKAEAVRENMAERETGT